MHTFSLTFVTAGKYLVTSSPSEKYGSSSSHWSPSSTAAGIVPRSFRGEPLTKDVECVLGKRAGFRVTDSDDSEALLGPFHALQRPVNISYTGDAEGAIGAFKGETGNGTGGS